MFIIGLTGGIATGKSTVLAVFRENGAAVLDADDIAREVVKPGTKAWSEIVYYFGREILLEDGSVDRRKLGDIIFNNTEKRKKLNDITHKRIRNRIIMDTIFYFLIGKKYLVIELPLLFESGRMINYLNKIITVVCNSSHQVVRLCKRNGLPLDKALQRIASQLPLEEKKKKSDFVIENDADILSAKLQVKEIMTTLDASWYPWYFRAGFIIFASSIFCGTVYAGSSIYSAVTSGLYILSQRASPPC